MGGPSRNPATASFTLIILSISLAIFMSSLDGTIVNIALPTISEDFGLSSSTVSWVATAYLLVMAGCVLVFGKISDIIGFKRVFLSGFALFTLGSFACATLPDLLGSFWVLVGSRIFQAVGGAMMTAIAPAMVTAYVAMEQKGKAMGVVMTFAGLGTAIGPTVGGILTQYLSWHWIFFINVPIGIIAVLLGTRVLPVDKTPGALTGFDRSGAVLIFSGMAFFLFGMTEGQEFGWTSPVILGVFVFAVIALAGFVWHELRVKDPVLELRLFSNKNFLATNLVMGLLFLSFAGINYLMPFYMQIVLSYDTASSGLILTSLSVAMMISGVIAGMLFNRVGGRALSVAAAAILLAGYYAIWHVGVSSTTVFLTGSLSVIGFGLGFMIPPVSNMVMNSVSKKYGGMVSSLLSLERFAGLTVGIAFFNMIFLQGVSRVAEHSNVTKTSPVSMQLPVLVSGFDMSFFVSFLLGIVILALTVVARQEVHPDYESGGAEEPVLGMA